MFGHVGLSRSILRVIAIVWIIFIWVPTHVEVTRKILNIQLKQYVKSMFIFFAWGQISRLNVKVALKYILVWCFILDIAQDFPGDNGMYCTLHRVDYSFILRIVSRCNVYFQTEHQTTVQNHPWLDGIFSCLEVYNCHRSQQKFEADCNSYFRSRLKNVIPIFGSLHI